MKYFEHLERLVVGLDGIKLNDGSDVKPYLQDLISRVKLFEFPYSSKNIHKQLHMTEENYITQIAGYITQSIQSDLALQMPENCCGIEDNDGVTIMRNLNENVLDSLFYLPADNNGGDYLVAGIVMPLSYQEKKHHIGVKVFFNYIVIDGERVISFEKDIEDDFFNSAKTFIEQASILFYGGAV